MCLIGANNSGKSSLAQLLHFRAIAILQGDRPGRKDGGNNDTVALKLESNQQLLLIHLCVDL